MKLTIIKEAPWTVKDRTITFKVGQVVEVGVDVPDHTGQEMLEHGYAEPSFKKDKLVQENKAVEKADENKGDTEQKPKKRGRKRKDAKE